MVDCCIRLEVNKSHVRYLKSKDDRTLCLLPLKHEVKFVSKEDLSNRRGNDLNARRGALAECEAKVKKV